MRYAKANNLLVILIVVINGYIILAPVMPSLLFGWHAQQHKQQLTAQLHAKSAPSSTANTPSTTAPQQNRVIIPSMLLDQPIYDGPESQQYKILNQGIWRFSQSSTPDKGGNTVLIGHRFTYTNPRGVFYFLNKVSVGDDMGVIWNNQKYLYKVTAVTEVSPDDTAIEAPSSQAKLTIFTCTPLWLPKDRLVVVANLEPGHD